MAHDPRSDALTIARVEELRLWFAYNLALPDRFCKSSAKGRYWRETKGLSWFKPDAHDHVGKAFELKALLDESGFGIDVLKECRIGYIVYEDACQIVAEPFSDTAT